MKKNSLNLARVSLKISTFAGVSQRLAMMVTKVTKVTKITKVTKVTEVTMVDEKVAWAKLDGTVPTG